MCIVFSAMVSFTFMKSGEVKKVPLVCMSVPLRRNAEDDSVNGS